MYFPPWFFLFYSLYFVTYLFSVRELERERERERERGREREIYIIEIVLHVFSMQCSKMRKLITC